MAEETSSLWVLNPTPCSVVLTAAAAVCLTRGPAMRDFESRGFAALSPGVRTYALRATTAPAAAQVATDDPSYWSRASDA